MPDYKVSVIIPVYNSGQYLQAYRENAIAGNDYLRAFGGKVS